MPNSLSVRNTLLVLLSLITAFLLLTGGMGMYASTHNITSWAWFGAMWGVMLATIALLAVAYKRELRP